MEYGSRAISIFFKNKAFSKASLIPSHIGSDDLQPSWAILGASLSNKGHRFKSPGVYLCETGILLLALSHYTLLIWACKLLRNLLSHTVPPPRNSLLLHRAAAKIGSVTRIHTAFWALRLHWTKTFIKGFRKSLNKAFLLFTILLNSKLSLLITK